VAIRNVRPKEVPPRVPLKLAGAVLAAGIAVAALFTVQQSLALLEGERQRLERWALLAAETARRPLGVALYNLDADLAAVIAAGLAEHPAILSVVVEDERGRRVAEAGLAAEPGRLAARLFDPVVRYRVPVAVDDGDDGATGDGLLVLRLDTDAAVARIADSLRAQAVADAVQAALLALLTLILVSRLVSDPVRRLARDVAMIDPAAPDGFTTPLSGRRDEFGLLARRVGEAFDAAAMAIDEAGTATRLQQASDRAALEHLVRFRVIAEASLQGICVHRGFRVLYCNAAYAGIFGTTVEDLEARGSLDHLIPEAHRPEAEANFARVMAGESVTHLELENRRADGSAVFLQISERRIDWDDGAPACCTLVVDVTPQVEARRRQQLLLDRSIQGIVVHRDFRALYCNDAYARMRGFESAEEVMAHGEMPLFDEDERRMVEEASRRVLETGRSEGPVVMRGVRRDGTAMFVALKRSRIRWDGAPAVYSTLVDVTELVRQREELAAAKAVQEETARRLELAAQAGRIGVFDLDVARDRVYCSPDHEVRLGYEPGALSAAGDRWRDAIHGADRGAVAARIDALAAGGPQLRDVEMRLRRADGSFVWVSMSADAIRGGDGALRVVGVMADIDARKRAELELQRYHHELEELVHERTEQLREAQTELVEAEKLAGLGSLVAGVAHEINTPVGVAVTGASLLDEDVRAFRDRVAAGGLKRSELEAFMERVGRGSSLVMANLQRAAALIRSFKQVAVDRASGERRTVRLASYLGDVLESLRPQWRRRPVRIDLQADADPALETDPGAIAQVVTNLVENALVHAFPGDAAGTITVRVAADDANALLTVADDGAGMPPEVQRRIFEPFFTTRRGQGGSGLGLHIVYNLVAQRLDGRIRVESEPGAGTRFTVSIPRQAPAAETAPARQEEVGAR